MNAVVQSKVAALRGGEDKFRFRSPLRKQGPSPRAQAREKAAWLALTSSAAPGSQLPLGRTEYGKTRLPYLYRFNAAASRASVVMREKSPLATASFGATHEPPTATTFASAR